MKLVRYFAYIRFSAISYVLMITISFALAIDLAFSPGLQKLLFDRLLVSMDPYLLGKYISINLFLLAYFTILFILFGLFEEKATVQISNQIKTKLLHYLFDADYAFFLEHDTGFFMKRIMEDSQSVAAAISKIFVILCNLILIASISAIFFHMEAFLFYIYCFLLGFSVLWSLIWIYPAHWFNVKIGTGYSKLYSYLFEIISGIKEIKFNTLNEVVMDKFQGTSRSLKLNFIANTAFGTMIWQLGFFFPLAAYGLILGFGLSKVKEGQISTGLLLGSLQCVWVAFNPVQQIIASISSVQLGVTAANRLQALFRAPAESSGSKRIQHFNDSISFQQVSFQYPNDTPLFREVSFDILKNQKIAFVGTSGAGKTTLVKILMKLTHGYAGRIMIDGNELASLDTRSFRKLFTYISQDSFIFHDTIRNNIDWNHRCSDTELMDILCKVQLSSFFHSLDNGLESLLGGDKSKMSGGEIQRIAIARCLANPSPIIILDEITSSLDPSTEEAILQVLAEFVKDKTVIIISHRIASLLDCDTLFVLNNGQIEAQGTHQELIEKNALYCRLFKEHAPKVEIHS